MTKTLRPVFRLPPAAEELDPPEAAELDPPELDAGVVEDDPLELQAARAEAAMTGSAIASASFLARLRCISLYPFNSGLCVDGLSVAWRVTGGVARQAPGWPPATGGTGAMRPGDRRRAGRATRSQRPAIGRKTLASSRPPVTMPVASCLKLVSSRAFWMPAKARMASTTPMTDPL